MELEWLCFGVLRTENALVGFCYRKANLLKLFLLRWSLDSTDCLNISFTTMDATYTSTAWIALQLFSGTQSSSQMGFTGPTTTIVARHSTVACFRQLVESVPSHKNRRMPTWLSSKRYLFSCDSFPSRRLCISFCTTWTFASAGIKFNPFDRLSLSRIHLLSIKTQ